MLKTCQSSPLSTKCCPKWIFPDLQEKKFHWLFGNILDTWSQTCLEESLWQTDTVLRMIIRTSIHTNGAYLLAQVQQELPRGRIGCQDCLKFPREEVQWQLIPCLTFAHEGIDDWLCWICAQAQPWHPATPEI